MFYLKELELYQIFIRKSDKAEIEVLGKAKNPLEIHCYDKTNQRALNLPQYTEISKWEKSDSEYYIKK